MREVRGVRDVREAGEVTGVETASAERAPERWSVAAPALADLRERERRFAAFVAEHRDRAVGLAWRLLGDDGAAAEDVAQEAFARAHRSLGRFREEARLSTWFYRILVNEVGRHRRWRWVRRRHAGEAPADPPDPAAAVPGDPALRARVLRALDTLPRGQREAFVMVHVEGWTVREVSQITGRAMGTVKSHLHRALRSLRAELSDLAPGAAAQEEIEP